MFNRVEGIITYLESNSSFSTGLKELGVLLCEICRAQKQQILEQATTRKRVNFCRFMNQQEVEKFLQTQDHRDTNIARRLMTLLLTSSLNNEQRLECLNYLQGICLLHRSSRQVLHDNTSMHLLLSLLNDKDEAIQTEVIGVLVAVLVREPANIRQFEECGGLKAMCSLFKSSDCPKEVKLKILEFLFFYLIPETSQPGKVAGGVKRYTTNDKSKLLSKYLSNVSGLVRELNTSQPFGPLNLEW